jgi:hypothetical protein
VTAPIDARADDRGDQHLASASRQLDAVHRVMGGVRDSDATVRKMTHPDRITEPAQPTLYRAGGVDHDHIAVLLGHQQ